MLDNDLDLFKKGNFQPIDNNFIMEWHEVLQEVQIVQEKYNKLDTDTFINELRDSIAWYNLWYELVNIEKHWFDCKKSADEECYLEVKSASFSAKDWQATFNDTTLEKAEAFKDKKVFLALAVWKDASDLLFICYGQNSEIWDFLESKVKRFKAWNTVRSTQSISLSNLVFTYWFKIIAVNRSKWEILSLLRLKNKNFLKMPSNVVISIEEYHNNIN